MNKPHSTNVLPFKNPEMIVLDEDDLAKELTLEQELASAVREFRITKAEARFVSTLRWILRRRWAPNELNLIPRISFDVSYEVIHSRKRHIGKVCITVLPEHALSEFPATLQFRWLSCFFHVIERRLNIHRYYTKREP